ncbi:cellulase family glycosylhydrolase [Halostella litorea]|uniref:cellulase family glycosylhydrolase n=1 Tax=Halostella litorea TaxID=2528831 RepID=UPI0010924F12|nr:cellulase family glycosylhydrolase [Halostella litorea]
MTRDGDDAPGDRRRFLAALAAAGVPAVAGCNRTGGESTEAATDEPTDSATGTATPTDTAEPTEPGPSAGIADLSVTPTPVGQYRTGTVAVTVANDGAEPFDGLVAVEFEDEFVDSTAVDLPAGERAEATVEFERGRVGGNPVTASLRDEGETLDSATAAVEVAPYPEHDVGVDGTDLVCGDGVVRFGGSSLANAFSPDRGTDLETAFDTIAERGVMSVRVFGFAPSWARIDSMHGPESYNDAWFEYFDHVVAAAKRRDIRLFVPLINGNPAYGPIGEENLSVNVPQFVRWADDAETRSDFFDSDECMAMFEGWVERLLTHENHLTGVEYRNDPTIAMWELGNEIQMSPPRVGESIRPWIEAAGAFVKDLDDRTLLTTGSYGHQGRNAFVDEASADPIDVVSIHYYPGPSHKDLPEEEVVPTLESTIETVREELGKPLYVGEYNWGVQPEDSAPYGERAEWVARLQGVMERDDVAATNFWTVAVEERPTSYHKHSTVYAPAESTTLDVIESHVRRMRAASPSSCVGAED